MMLYFTVVFVQVHYDLITIRGVGESNRWTYRKILLQAWNSNWEMIHL